MKPLFTNFEPITSKEWKQSSHDELKQVIVGPKKTLFHLGDNYGHSDKRDGLKVYVRSKIETEKLLIFIIILYTTINDYDAIALGLDGMSEGYLISGTNTIDPTKDAFAQQNYFQNLNQAITSASNYRDAVAGFGTSFC
jgi:hypothetical protein